MGNTLSEIHSPKFFLATSPSMWTFCKPPPACMHTLDAAPHPPIVQNSLCLITSVNVHNKLNYYARNEGRVKMI